MQTWHCPPSPASTAGLSGSTSGSSQLKGAVRKVLLWKAVTLLFHCLSSGCFWEKTEHKFGCTPFSSSTHWACHAGFPHANHCLRYPQGCSALANTLLSDLALVWSTAMLSHHPAVLQGKHFPSAALIPPRHSPRGGVARPCWGAHSIPGLARSRPQPTCGCPTHMSTYLHPVKSWPLRYTWFCLLDAKLICWAIDSSRLVGLVMANPWTQLVLELNTAEKLSSGERPRHLLWYKGRTF